jgi:probable biosynthetic protein (TIGR04099 family)
MPQLEAAGLSQNWLLKECGHHHWRALANLLGLDGPDFRDPDGSTVYASFLLVKLEKLQLDAIGNDQAFNLRCEIEPLSSNRFLSTHQLEHNGMSCGKLIMVSTLVRHQDPNDNLTLTAAKLAFEGVSRPVQEHWLHLINDSRNLRKDIPPCNWDCVHQSENTLPEFVYSPTPSIDFNGAGLLYFANFQAIVEQAEWFWACNDEQWPIRERQLSYYGNLNIGDHIQVVCRSLKYTDSSLDQWVSLYRTSDNKKIGDVLTKRAKVNHV